jgi:SAM-dependent methyltransferase
VDEPGDLDLYRALAARADGPILELAVGTGRVAVPLAEAGYEVTGVDVDPAMLERARRAAERAGVSARLALVEADARDIRLPSAGSIGLAFIALNTMLLLPTRSDQGAVVRTLAEHLRPGGTAAIDVWLPDAADLGRFDGRLMLEYAREDPETRGFVTKTASAVHDGATGTVALTSIYEGGTPGAPSSRWIRRDHMRLVSADDLVDFVRSAGLTVETLAGDYDLEPFGPGSERAIVVARKGDAGR